MKHPLKDVTALLLAALVAAALARPVPAASPAAEASARLLAQVEPQIKAIYERDEFAVRSFTATWLLAPVGRALPPPAPRAAGR